MRVKYQRTSDESKPSIQHPAGRVGIALVIVLAVALLLFGIFIIQGNIGRSVMARIGIGRESVYCDELPPVILEQSNKARVDTTVQILKRNILDFRAKSENTQIPSEAILDMANFLVLARSLCLDAASGLIDKEDYKLLKYKVLPVLKERAEARAGFDIDIVSVNVISLDKGRSRAKINIKFIAQSKNNLDIASIMWGLIVLHDEVKAGPTRGATPSTTSCKDEPSCLNFSRDSVSETNPLFIRGGTDSFIRTVDIDYQIQKKPKLLRVYAEYYQREAGNGSICVVDQSKPAPLEGLPFLTVIDATGKRLLNNACYNARKLKAISL